MGNFPFWEILSCCLVFCKLIESFFMQKSKYTTNYKKLLKLLKQKRKDAGLTQTEVAQHFGTYASFVSKCESGERRIDVIELTEFCHIYGITINSFLKELGLL